MGRGVPHAFPQATKRNFAEQTSVSHLCHESGIRQIFRRKAKFDCTWQGLQPGTALGVDLLRLSDYRPHKLNVFSTKKRRHVTIFKRRRGRLNSKLHRHGQPVLPRPKLAAGRQPQIGGEVVRVQQLDFRHSRGGHHRIHVIGILFEIAQMKSKLILAVVVCSRKRWRCPPWVARCEQTS